jgi:hypothetical protein
MGDINEKMRVIPEFFIENFARCLQRGITLKRSSEKNYLARINLPCQSSEMFRGCCTWNVPVEFPCSIHYFN